MDKMFLDNLSQLIYMIHRDHKEFSLMLSRVQGWRGLLDPFCDEYKDSDIEQKVRVFRVLLDYASFEEIIDLFVRTE